MHPSPKGEGRYWRFVWCRANHSKPLILKDHVRISGKILKAQIYSAGCRPRPVNDARGNSEGVSSLQLIRLVSCNVDFQLAFENQKTLIGVRMFVPAEFPLHDRHANGVVVHVEKYEVLIDLLARIRFLFHVDYR